MVHSLIELNSSNSAFFQASKLLKAIQAKINHKETKQILTPYEN